MENKIEKISSDSKFNVDSIEDKINKIVDRRVAAIIKNNKVSNTSQTLAKTVKEVKPESTKNTVKQTIVKKEVKQIERENPNKTTTKTNKIAIPSAKNEIPVGLLN